MKSDENYREERIRDCALLKKMYDKHFQFENNSFSTLLLSVVGKEGDKLWFSAINDVFSNVFFQNISLLHARMRLLFAH